MLEILSSLAVFASIKWCFSLSTFRKRPHNAKFVGNVSGLYLYPVKSCKAVLLNDACCTFSGLKHRELLDVFDRHYMVTHEDGRFLSQRSYPAMTLISVTVTDDTLYLNAPGMSTLTVDRKLQITEKGIMNCRVWSEDVEGLDCGQETADWLSKYLGTPCRLVYAAPQLKKRHLCEIPNSDKWHKMTKQEDKVAFPDFAPYLLITDASLKDLNKKLDKSVEMKQFRPNITVEGFTIPFSEDTWKYVYIGSCRFNCFKPCSRCSMTTVDPSTGVKGSSGEPLKTLKTYRRKHGHGSDPCFGMNMLLDFPGMIAVGDPVYVISKDADSQ